MKVWPSVDARLSCHAGLLHCADDEELVRQGLASMRLKRFHALGGAVYSLYPGADTENTVRFVSAFQTISDYLDNLCDRAGISDERAFSQLHLSMMDAVEPDTPVSDYYLYYPHKSDNGYLSSLVSECRLAVKKLPSYGIVKDKLKKLVELYSQMQSLKHLERSVSEKKLAAWAAPYLGKYPQLSLWEFSAAAGSTLGIFSLFAAAHGPSLSAGYADILYASYFPWICGLHILLDYYIDSDEDRKNGDLNFTYYYKDVRQCLERLSLFISKSVESCRMLSFRKFHLSIVNGLLALYLSDPKALADENSTYTRKLLKAGGIDTYFYFLICRYLRKKGKL